MPKDALMPTRIIQLACRTEAFPVLLQQLFKQRDGLHKDCWHLTFYSVLVFVGVRWIRWLFGDMREKIVSCFVLSLPTKGEDGEPVGKGGAFLPANGSQLPWFSHRHRLIRVGDWGGGVWEGSGKQSKALQLKVKENIMILQIYYS